RMNLELAATEEMLRIALQVRPQDVCLVPEKREEVTTEGGLDVLGGFAHLRGVCAELAQADIRVSLFIDPEPAQIEAAARIAPVIELHTGAYADSRGARQQAELERLQAAARLASELGLVVNAGHGLHYHN